MERVLEVVCGGGSTADDACEVSDHHHDSISREPSKIEFWDAVKRFKKC